MYRYVKKILIFLVVLLFGYQIVGCGSSGEHRSFIESDLEITSLSYAIECDTTVFTFKIKNKENVGNSYPTIVYIYNNGNYIDNVDIVSLEADEEKTFSYQWKSKEGTQKFKFEINKKPDGTYFSDELNTENNSKEMSLTILPKYISLNEFKEITKDDTVIQDFNDYLNSTNLKLTSKNTIRRMISNDGTYYLSKLDNSDTNNESIFILVVLSFKDNNTLVFLPYIVETQINGETLKVSDSYKKFSIKDKIVNIYFRIFINKNLKEQL